MAYGSLVNQLLGTASDLVPVVGMGATKIMWSDRKPYTVVEVINTTTVVVQEDDYKRVDTNGMSDSQSYEFSPNPEGIKYTVTRRKNGQWVRKGSSMKDGAKFCLGTRDKYHDFSF